MIKKIALWLAVPFLVFAVQGVQVESAIPGYSLTTGAYAANGTLEFFENNGSFTYKDVYSDALLSSAISQPIALNSSGQPASTVFANGVYTVRLKDSAGSTIWTKTDLSYSKIADFGGIYVDVLGAYGATNAALDSLISDYTGSSSKITALFKEGDYTVTATKKFPSNITMKFLPGARLNISTGITATISGNIEAGNYQVKTGAGTLSVATVNNPVILDDWFNASSTGVVRQITTVNTILSVGSIPKISTIDTVVTMSVAQLNGTQAVISTMNVTSASISQINSTAISVGALNVTTVNAKLYVAGDITGNRIAVTSISTSGNTALKMVCLGASPIVSSGTSFSVSIDLTPYSPGTKVRGWTMPLNAVYAGAIASDWVITANQNGYNNSIVISGSGSSCSFSSTIWITVFYTE